MSTRMPGRLVIQLTRSGVMGEDNKHGLIDNEEFFPRVFHNVFA